MIIKGEKIEIFTASIHYKMLDNDNYEQTVEMRAMVDGVEVYVNEKSKDTTDFKEKTAAFLRGETITEITI